ncbi:MAG: polymer-forming cytoskeletal protein [Tepidisphaeraceae bacterium]
MPAPSTSVPPPDDRLTIACLHCDKQQEVGRKAMSITCKFCSKPLKLEDIPIKDYQARRVIETVGVVTVEKKGSAITDRINCGGLIVRGKVKGNIKSRGPVFVGPEAEIKGDIVAPAIAVGAGAILEGRYEIGKLDAPQ